MSSDIRVYMQTHTALSESVSKMLLNLDDLLIYEIREDLDDITKPLEVICTPNAKNLYPDTNGISVCPHCQSAVKNLQGYKDRTIDDLPIRDRRTVLRILYATHYCTKCKKSFSPKLACVRPREKVTVRLKDKIAEESFGKNTFLSVAAKYHVSDTLVHTLLTEEAETRHADCLYTAKKHLCIDETYIHCKGQKKGILCVSVLGIDTDCDGAQSVVAFDYPPKRDIENIVKMLSKLDKPEIVETISMDMNTAFRTAVETVIPHGRIIVDRYHLVQSLNDKVKKVATNIYHEKMAECRTVLRKQIDPDTIKMGDEIEVQSENADELAEILNSAKRKQYLETIKKINAVSIEQEAAKQELVFLTENYHNAWFVTNPENLSHYGAVKFHRLLTRYPEFDQLYTWKEKLRLEFFEAESAEEARSIADEIEHEIPSGKIYRPLKTYFMTLNHSEWTTYIYDYFTDPVGKRYSNAVMEEFNRDVKELNRNAKGLTPAILRDKVLFGDIVIPHVREKHCTRSELSKFHLAHINYERCSDEPTT